MTKTKMLWIGLCLIFPAVFNISFFVLGGSQHNTSVWISYCFIHFAYGMLVFTRRLTHTGKSTAVFGFSLYVISSVYFVISFILGVLFILVAPESNTAALLLQLLVSGLYGIIFIANMLANERTGVAEEQRQLEIAYVKDASKMLKRLMDKTHDKEIKKRIEVVYDIVYSSPVKSHPSVVENEERILQLISEFEDNIMIENNNCIVGIVNTLLNEVNERNRLLKTLS